MSSAFCGSNHSNVLPLGNHSSGCFILSPIRSPCFFGIEISLRVPSGNACCARVIICAQSTSSKSPPETAGGATAACILSTEENGDNTHSATGRQAIIKPVTITTTNKGENNTPRLRWCLVTSRREKEAGHSLHEKCRRVRHQRKSPLKVKNRPSNASNPPRVVPLGPSKRSWCKSNSHNSSRSSRDAQWVMTLPRLSL